MKFGVGDRKGLDDRLFNLALYRGSDLIKVQSTQVTAVRPDQREPLAPFVRDAQVSLRSVHPCAWPRGVGRAQPTLIQFNQPYKCTRLAPRQPVMLI